MSLTDTIFILIGALVLFGPKKLPELARQLGKIMGELRRASNEFKFQMEDELRQSEAAERQAAQAAAPVPAVMTQSVPTAPAILPPSTGEPIANVSARPQAPAMESTPPELIVTAPQEATPHA
jgi:sec-independent protein translocase protein TatB